MKLFGPKGFLLLLTLALAWPTAIPAFANGGGSGGAGTTEENGTGSVDDESEPTGSIGGTAPSPEGTSGGAGSDVSQPQLAIPADGSRMGNPCPLGYLLSDDGHMCARP